MKKVELATVEAKIEEVKTEKESLAKEKLEIVEQHSAAIESLIKEKIQAELPRIKEEATTEIVGSKLAEIDTKLDVVSKILDTLESLVVEETEETEA